MYDVSGVTVHQPHIIYVLLTSQFYLFLYAIR